MSKRKTKLVSVDPEHPDEQAIADAAARLRDGQLVAFPTETVYGLGAVALSSAYVNQIFVAKGRPATNPLIVHIAHIEQARELVDEWSEAARRLAEVFWPGPLTLVLRRSGVVPDAVCAGLDTVALRMPAHPVARALIDAVGEPLAAPSANRSTEISPTTAQHVLRGLDGRIDLVLDAGATEVGLESTLVSLLDTPIEILRPGMITRQQLSEVLGDTEIAGHTPQVVDDRQARPSPGLSKRHYAPGIPLRLMERENFSQALLRDEKTRRRAFIGISSEDTDTSKDEAAARRIWLPPQPKIYARQIYAVLHHIDQLDVDEIIVEMPPEGDRWAAIRDRLRRAAESE